VHTSSDVSTTAGASAPPPVVDSAAVGPVFVDPSGRRQRRVRRVGWLLVVPAAGYVAVLLSTVLGGPSSPFLPLPEAGGHPHNATAPPSDAPSHGSVPARPNAPTAGSHAPRTTGPGSSAADAGSHGSAATASAGVTATPGPALSPTASPSTSPSAQASSASPAPSASHGKSTATHPVPTHTGNGHS
jgi:hypothetical protein